MSPKALSWPGRFPRTSFLTGYAGSGYLPVWIVFARRELLRTSCGRRRQAGVRLMNPLRNPAVTKLRSCPRCAGDGVSPYSGPGRRRSPMAASIFRRCVVVAERLLVAFQTKFLQPKRRVRPAPRRAVEFATHAGAQPCSVPDGAERSGSPPRGSRCRPHSLADGRPPGRRPFVRPTPSSPGSAVASTCRPRSRTCHRTATR